MDIAAFATVGFLLASLGAFLVYRHVTAGRLAGQAHCHARCPRCTQKLRFLASKVGQLGRCPRCRHPFILTDSPTDPLDLTRSGLLRVIRASRSEASRLSGRGNKGR